MAARVRQWKGRFFTVSVAEGVGFIETAMNQ